MTTPEDTTIVINAFRLGWYLAEVRGRNRPDAPESGGPGVPAADDHPLPLRIERTTVERRIEAQGVLAELARELDVDVDRCGGSYGSRVDQDAHRLANARRTPGAVPAVLTKQWVDLGGVLWEFDSHIQDALTSVSEMQACAYQLGRGLAETYWALDPWETENAHGWKFLFGEHRCAELSRLLGRLSAYLDTYTGSAIDGSLEIWKEFAKGAAFDKNNADQMAEAGLARNAMRDQVRRWYELIVLGQDPTTLIKPFDVLGNFRTLKQAARQFWPQVAATTIGLGFLVAFLILLGVGGGSGLVRTVGVILATTGLSIGGITGALKNSAQGLLVRLRQDTYTELVTEGVVVQPPEMSKGIMRKAVAKRTLTPITAG